MWNDLPNFKKWNVKQLSNEYELEIWKHYFVYTNDGIKVEKLAQNEQANTYDTMLEREWRLDFSVFSIFVYSNEAIS